MTCNCCLAMKLADHKCREKGLETNCPICCDDMFSSSAVVRALPCGHFMHSACFQVSLYLILVCLFFSFFLLLPLLLRKKCLVELLLLNPLPLSLCQAYTCSHYICPICSKSLGDMAVRKILSPFFLAFMLIYNAILYSAQGSWTWH